MEKKKSSVNDIGGGGEMASPQAHNGYFKLWRELFQKPIWQSSTPEQKTILITLLSMANYKEKEWEWKGKKYCAKPGQFVTSLENIAKAAGKGISIRNVRTALERFEKLEFLTNESTKTGRLVTIANWELYQSCNEYPTNELTKTRQRGDKDLTTREEGKKGKNDKNIYISEFESFYSLYPNPFNKAQTYKNWMSLLKKGESIENIMKAANHYLQYVKDNGTESQYITRSSNFIGQKAAYLGYLDYQSKVEDSNLASKNTLKTIEALKGIPD